MICASLLVVLTLAACTDKAASDSDTTEERIMKFDTAQVRLTTPRDTLQLTVELAVTSEQKTMGLMERRHLAPSAGMLFVYDSTQPPDAGFWMFRTRIPLDIAFLDSAGVVRSVRTMQPCEARIAQGCPTYNPDVPYRYALEVNAGYFQQHGVGVGSTLLLSDLPASIRPSPARPGSATP
jgi:uncharacterized membrane protein (UPF0127 family)